MFTQLFIQAKFTRQYRCHICNRAAEGTTESVDIAGVQVQSYTLDSSAFIQRAHNMPVGWGSYRGDYGYTVFRCPVCIKRLQGEDA